MSLIFLRSLLVLLFGVLLGGSIGAAGTQAVPVKRCGWFSNPTPANAWLLDRDAEWTLSTQGGAQAEGDWPDFKPSQWVETNGHYGYGCACMSVVADSKTHQVSVIKSARAQGLSVCRRDRSLRSPR